jgi:hypothetical protein
VDPGRSGGLLLAHVLEGRSRVSRGGEGADRIGQRVGS